MATVFVLRWSGQLLVPATCATLFAGNESNSRCAMAARPIRACCDVALAFLMHMKSFGVDEARCPPLGIVLAGQLTELVLGAAEATVQAAGARAGCHDCSVR